MEPPSSLPLGWRDMPIDILLETNLRLPYQEALKNCQSFHKMRVACNDRFWRNKAEFDFGDGYFTIVYEYPYFNYLVARVRSLEARIDQFFAELRTFGVYYINHDNRYMFYRQPEREVRTIFTRAHAITNKLWEIIDREIERRGKPPKTQFDQEDKDIAVDYIFHKFDIFLPNRLQQEADSISLILARYLRKTQPDSFNLIFLDNNQNYPEELERYWLSIHSDEAPPAPGLANKMAKILFEEGYSKEDIFFYHLDNSPFSFFLEEIGPNNYQFLSNPIIDTFSVEGQTRLSIHRILPKEFFSFALALGLNDAAISWLYNVKEEFQKQFPPRRRGISGESA